MNKVTFECKMDNLSDITCKVSGDVNGIVKSEIFDVKSMQFKEQSANDFMEWYAQSQSNLGDILQGLISYVDSRGE